MTVVFADYFIIDKLMCDLVCNVQLNVAVPGATSLIRIYVNLLIPMGLKIDGQGRFSLTVTLGISESQTGH